MAVVMALFREPNGYNTHASNSPRPGTLRITNALIVPGDLPLITSESITALLQSAHLQHRG